jgi:BirA family biotin operon repressor/biotin-[acetyl-CoA-carboxylase] ligase
MRLSDLPIIELDSIDSTNNYAMQLIDADKSQNGMAIVARKQEAGKGQRGNTWKDTPGQSLLMSIIVTPKHEISKQFVFSASVAVAIANVLQKLNAEWKVNIKWPNDIIINDKKAGGILIENILRGSKWSHSIIGIGMNIQQTKFPQSLPFATSLKLESGTTYDITKIRELLREAILQAVLYPSADAGTMQSYNEYLYKRGVKQGFSEENKAWVATVLEAGADGVLKVQLENGDITLYRHGAVLWEWRR